MMLYVHTPSFIFVIVHGFCANVLRQDVFLKEELRVPIPYADHWVGSPMTISLFPPEKQWPIEQYKEAREEFKLALRLRGELGGRGDPIFTEIITAFKEFPSIDAPPSVQPTEEDLEERISELPTAPAQDPESETAPDSQPDSVDRISVVEMMRASHPSDALDEGWSGKQEEVTQGKE